MEQVRHLVAPLLVPRPTKVLDQSLELVPPQRVHDARRGEVQVLQAVHRPRGQIALAEPRRRGLHLLAVRVIVAGAPTAAPAPAAHTAAAACYAAAAAAADAEAAATTSASSATSTANAAASPAARPAALDAGLERIKRAARRVRVEGPVADLVVEPARNLAEDEGGLPAVGRVHDMETMQQSELVEMGHRLVVLPNLAPFARAVPILEALHQVHLSRQAARVHLAQLAREARVRERVQKVGGRLALDEHRQHELITERPGGGGARRLAEIEEVAGGSAQILLSITTVLHHPNVQQPIAEVLPWLLRVHKQDDPMARMPRRHRMRLPLLGERVPLSACECKGGRPQARGGRRGVDRVLESGDDLRDRPTR